MSEELPVLGQGRPGPTPAVLPATTPLGARSVYLETYGCQMNLADTELLRRILLGAGYALVDAPEDADVVLLNTCAVREHAETRVIGRAAQLHGLRRYRPGMTLGVLGCMAQRLAAELPRRAPFVDLVVGPDAYRRLPELLEQTGEEAVLDVRHRRSEDYAGIEPARRQGCTGWVTIMRGCDRFCTFCVVPFVRGRERSLPVQEILDQVARAADAGVREVTLLGQTVNSYRHDGTSFADLLRQVAGVPGIWRVRFTSPHPADLNAETIEVLASVPAVCPSLHLPVQSGSDAQLGLMHRGYTVAHYRGLVEQLRSRVPDLALTTDVVVGFCGETDADYAQTVALMEEVRFDGAFLFKYSPREGTHAWRQLPDDVPAATKQERLARIIALQEQISEERNRAWTGRSVEVLIEACSRASADAPATAHGRTPQGKNAVVAGEQAIGTRVQVRVARTTAHTLIGAGVDSRGT
jgi:tRNA-2-methylthio-N6-dimethylallyladenosine synthase